MRASPAVYTLFTVTSNYRLQIFYRGIKRRDSSQLTVNRSRIVLKFMLIFCRRKNGSRPFRLLLFFF